MILDKRRNEYENNIEIFKIKKKVIHQSDTLQIELPNGETLRLMHQNDDFLIKPEYRNQFKLQFIGK